MLTTVLASEADQISAATVAASDGVSDHEDSLPNNSIWATTITRSSAVIVADTQVQADLMHQVRFSKEKYMF